MGKSSPDVSSHGEAILGQAAALAAMLHQKLIGKAVLVLAATLGTLRMALGLVAWRAANNLEQPQYTTTLRTLPGNIELRQYDEYLVAEHTTPPVALRDSTRDGFRAVAGYIFGKNRQQTKMAMTAPVRVEGGADIDADRKRISFVMGSEYTLGSLPRPAGGSSVKLKSVRPHILAVRRFSGPPPSASRVRKERSTILRALEGKSLRPVGGADAAETLVYGYHDPFITPSFVTSCRPRSCKEERGRGARRALERRGVSS